MFKKLSYLAVISGFIFFSACSKDSSNNNTNNQTTAQKIQHRWTFEKEIDRSSGSGTVFLDTIVGLPGDYYDFQANNKVYRRRVGLFDTLNYTVLGTDRIIFSGLFSLPDTFNIQLLTDQKFQFKNVISAVGFVNEATIFLVR